MRRPAQAEFNRIRSVTLGGVRKNASKKDKRPPVGERVEQIDGMLMVWIFDISKPGLAS